MRPLNLGQLIGRLERFREDATVRFDFGSLVPTTVDSYRGYYDQLAVGHETWKQVLVSDFVKVLRSAIGATYTGYKGGEYYMDEDTPVWVANNGECHGTGIIGVIDKDYMAVLETGYCE